MPRTTSNAASRIVADFFTSFGLILIMVDIIFYGWLLPVFGAMITSWATEFFHLSPQSEIIFLVTTVMLLLVLVLNLKFERKFWKHFFAHEQTYMNILTVREIVNLGFLCILIYDLIEIIQSVGNDHGLKPVFLTEGTKYAFIHNLILGSGDKEFLKESWRQCAEAKERVQYAAEAALPTISTDSEEMTYIERGLLWIDSIQNTYFSFGNSVEKELLNRDAERCVLFAQYLNAAHLSLCIAYITAHMGKVLYFGTLSAYARAMDIFVSINLNRNTPIAYRNVSVTSEESTNTIRDSLIGSEEDDSDDDDEDDDDDDEGLLPLALQSNFHSNTLTLTSYPIDPDIPHELVDRTTSLSLSRIPSTRRLNTPGQPPQRPLPITSEPTQREAATTQGFNLSR